MKKSTGYALPDRVGKGETTNRRFLGSLFFAKGTWALLLIGAIMGSASAQFVVADIHMGDSASSYLDFEFWQTGNRICFQDENNRGYVGRIDSLTGLFSTYSGKDFLIDSFLAPITQSINGPEWGYRQGGADVFFTHQINNQRSIGSASWNGTGYDYTNLSSSLSGNRFAVLCSKNPGDAVPDLLYAKGNNILNFTLNWSSATQPVADIQVPYGANSSSGPRFIEGDASLVTNDVVNGLTQIFRYDLFPPSLTQLTFDGGNKIDAFVFTAPDFGGGRLMFCTVNDASLRLYKEELGAFVPQYDIHLPDTAYHYYFSAEPFVFQNKSYLFVCAAAEKFIPGSQNNSLPADVWLVGLEQTGPLFRKVSDNRIALRLDPEVFLTPDEAYIYYYEYKQNGNVHPIALHRCSTGLGDSPLTGLERPEKITFSVYPNPFSDFLQISGSHPFESYRLLNSQGKTVYQGVGIEQQDFSLLPAGIYCLQGFSLRSDGGKTITLIKK